MQQQLREKEEVRQRQREKQMLQLQDLKEEEELETRGGEEAVKLEEGGAVSPEGEAGAEVVKNDDMETKSLTKSISQSVNLQLRVTDCFQFSFPLPSLHSFPPSPLSLPPSHSLPLPSPSLPPIPSLSPLPPSLPLPSPSLLPPFVPSLPPSLPPRTLLRKVGENDMKQVQIVFNSIDKNHDGELSLSELEEFAIELG